MSQNLSASADSNVYVKGDTYRPPYLNEPDWYSELREKQHLKRDEMLSSVNRFQHINERVDQTDVPVQATKNWCSGRHLARYRGFDICKSPIDYVLYQQLFDMVKPKTVIELGTCSGGMAVWMADTLELLGIKSNIYSMDLDITNRSELVNKLKPENVRFLQGDSFKIEKTFTDEFLKSLPHPWVFIEDAHENVDGVLEYFHRYLQEGDYMVVEDTSPDIPEDCSIYMGKKSQELQGAAYVSVGSKDLQCLRQFLHDYGEFYAVDSFLTDLFGYNCSWHWHGFIRRMK